MRAGVRANYPLKLTRAATTVAARTVLIGNAAQALHPVAGQGFNLGLRDAAMLAEIVVAAQGSDVGSPELLRRFAAWRAGDRHGVIRFTDGLVKMFGDTRPGIGMLRNLGLLLFDLAPPAKSALARVSAGSRDRRPGWRADSESVRDRNIGPTGSLSQAGHFRYCRRGRRSCWCLRGSVATARFVRRPGASACVRARATPADTSHARQCVGTARSSSVARQRTHP